jgi:hypothetical protein
MKTRCPSHHPGGHWYEERRGNACACGAVVVACSGCGRRNHSIEGTVEQLRNQVRVLRAALEPFNVIINDWYGARNGGQSSMVIYRDDIEAVATALSGSGRSEK